MLSYDDLMKIRLDVLQGKEVSEETLREALETTRQQRMLSAQGGAKKKSGTATKPAPSLDDLSKSMGF